MTDYGNYRAMSFDCYGTLVDWEAGILAAAGPWLAQADGRIDEVGFLQTFGQCEREEQSAAPSTLYPEILARVLRRVGESAGVPVTDAQAAAFGASVGDWPVFRDSHDALAALKQTYELIILSNVDRASFRRSNDRLGVTFDRIITAEVIRRPDKLPEPNYFDPASLSGPAPK